MKLIKQFLTVLIVGVLIVAGVGMVNTSTARATSPFTCGQTSLDLDTSLPGTISCETGEDYIRWTFSGLSARTHDFTYDYIASQAGWAELRTNVEFSKTMWQYWDAYARNYVWVGYGDGSFNTYPQVLGPGPGTGLNTEENASPYSAYWGDTYTTQDNKTRLIENFIPGSGKVFHIFRDDVSAGSPPQDQMDGSVELRVVAQGQSSLVSTSPFYCAISYRSNPPEVASLNIAPGVNEHRPYFSLLEGLTCEEGSNYIKWTFEKQSPFVYGHFGIIPELQGEALHVEVSYKRSGFSGGSADAPNHRSTRFFFSGQMDTGLMLWDIHTQPAEANPPDWTEEYPTYTYETAFDGTLSGGGDWGFEVGGGDAMALDDLGRAPWHDNVRGYVLITAPNYINTAATATAQGSSDLTATAQAGLTGTAEADLTATAAVDLTGTAAVDLTATALAGTPSATATQGGGGPGPGDPPGNPTNPPGHPTNPPNPTITPVPTWTATSTRTPTATVTATGTRTPTRTPTPGPSPTATGTGTATRTATSGPSPTFTSTPHGGGTATFTSTPYGGGTATFTSTPYGGRTATATATASGGGTATYTSTPYGGGTATYTSTPNGGGTSTPFPNYPGTLTAIAGIVKTATAANGGGGNATATSSVPFGAGGGSGTSGTSGATTAGTATVYSGPCSAYLRVLAYVDTNSDNIMALQGEGVSGVGVNLADADYNVISELGMENGIVKFCIPDYLAGQIVYVDIPYLLRSGSIQAPRAQNSSSNPFGSSTSGTGLQTLELFFKLDAPTLPLALP